jgi:hypothetical protein
MSTSRNDPRAKGAQPSHPRVGGTQYPKAAGDETTADNRIKDQQDWVTGDEPMTGAQESYLKTLSEQVHDPEAFDPSLDKAEASERIDDLKRKRDGDQG